jgi:hypothetical protein
MANRKGVRLHHNKAKPETALETLQKQRQLKSEVMTHPLHSPNIARTDYLLFRSLRNHLTEKRFRQRQRMMSQRSVVLLFSSKLTDLYQWGIQETVVNNNENDIFFIMFENSINLISLHMDKIFV